ncbi:hypothetical protein GCM10010294_25170 [Streptomyces griseoloalbus]|uniref:hypothetical protein n=1 Tax=Streptomyces griseoloalbus TaxID=67303 RepID=UPI001875BA93|nr:hypothetical protein GCM10010294_25170 [Streptomyces griseoloalbus]
MPERTDLPTRQPTPTRPTPPAIGELYIQASEQHHLARCAPCRDLRAASDANAAANADSMARRDRRGLDLRIGSAVTA